MSGSGRVPPETYGFCVTATVAKQALNPEPASGRKKRARMTEMKRNTAEGESWTWSESPRTNTVRICGEIDFTVSPVVRDKLVAFIEQTRGDVFLDLGELDYVDSSGLAALIEGRKILKAKGRKITITAVSRQVRKLFELTQIGDLFGL